MSSKVKGTFSDKKMIGKAIKDSFIKLNQKHKFKILLCF